MLRISQLSCSIPDGVQILTDFNLDVRQGEFVVITGDNGSGKSTLLQVLFELNQSKPHLSNYHVNYDEFDCDGDVSIVYQNPDGQLLTFSVREEIVTQLSFKGITRDVRVDTSRELAEQFKLQDLWERDPHHLSSGEKQKVVVISNMADDQKLLLLDEPLSYLDQESITLFLKELDEMKRRGVTIIVTTHTPFFSELADRFVRLGPRSEEDQRPLYDLTNQPKGLIMNDTIPVGYNKIINHTKVRLHSTGVFFVLGPNGSGKTCLLLTLLGKHRQHYTSNLKDKPIGFVPANPIYVFSRPSIAEEFADLELPSQFEIKKRVSPYVLSTGEQKFLALVIMLQRFDIVCIDELFLSLDLRFQAIILGLIERYKEEKLIIITTNRESYLKELKFNKSQIIRMGDV